MKVEWVPLATILTQRGSSVVDNGEAYPIAGVRGFGRGLLLRDSVLGNETKYPRLTMLQPNDVVYSKVKAFEGAVTVVPSDVRGRWVSPEFPVFAIAPQIDPKYLAHYLASEDFLKELRETSSGIGARRERVAPQAFLGLKIPLPASSDQERVANFLDRLATVPGAKAIAPRWARAFAGRLLLEATAEANRVRLGDLLTPVAGIPTDPDAEYPIAGVYSFGRGLLRRPPIRGFETKYRTLTQLKAGAVVYSKLGAFEGAVAVVDPAFDGTWVSPEFPTFTASDAVDVRYLRQVLTSPSFESQLAAATAGVGARQKRVSPAVFLDQVIRLPGLSNQRAVAEKLELVHEIQSVADRSREIRAALIPAARNEIFSAMR